MQEIISTILEISQAMGYPGILVLMTIESSFIPFPSEIIIPPAAYLAQQGTLNIYLVIFFGILGSLLGATINYLLARYLGRIVVYKLIGHKFSRALLLSEKKLAHAEGYFLRYGNSSTFIGRLVPAVRQLISLPAGFCKMKFRDFIFFTFLGSGTWVVILALLGYFLGANQELLGRYYKEISLFFIAFGIGFVLLLFYKSKVKKNNIK
jgi:membrane protein DedA with SNARE-associated domain